MYGVITGHRPRVDPFCRGKAAGLTAVRSADLARPSRSADVRGPMPGHRPGLFGEYPRPSAALFAGGHGAPPRLSAAISAPVRGDFRDYPRLFAQQSAAIYASVRGVSPRCVSAVILHGRWRLLLTDNRGASLGLSAAISAAFRAIVRG